MKVYLDKYNDRSLKGWVHAAYTGEAISLLKTGSVVQLSVGYELENGVVSTVLEWLENAIVNEGLELPTVRIHVADKKQRWAITRTVARLIELDTRRRLGEFIS
jgi:hypothetical protein